MPAHRIGEVETALHVLPGRGDDLGEVGVLLLRAQDFEALDQRKSGVDHDGELPDEDGQQFRGNRLAGGLGAALLLLRDGGDGDAFLAQPRGHFIGVGSDALARVGLAILEFAFDYVGRHRRSPLVPSLQVNQRAPAAGASGRPVGAGRRERCSNRRRG